jgi:hypothetical protein
MPTVRKETSKAAHAVRTMLDTPLVRGVRGGCGEEGAKLDMILGRVKGRKIRRDKGDFTVFKTLTWPGKRIFHTSYLAVAHSTRSITPTSKRGTSVQLDISDNHS